MKGTTRILCMALAFVMMACLFAGCGSQSTQSSEPPASKAPTATAPASTAPDAAPSADAPALDFGEYSPENPLVLKIATHAYGGDTNIMCITPNRIADALDEASGGAVQLEVYNEAILTKNDRETIEQVISGTIDMGVSNTAIYSSYVNDYSVLDLCYLFENMDHVKTFMNSDVAADLMGMMEDADTGVTILSFNYLGSKNVASSRPVQSMSDMKGLKLKCSTGEYYIKGFTAFGAAPQSISSSEVLAALSQGMIDGVEQSSAIVLSGNYLEYVPYITHTGHIIQMFSININSNTYNALTPDLQQLIKDTCMNVSAELFDVSEQMQQDAEVAMAGKGITFYDVDKTEWMEAMQPVYQEFSEKYGSELIDSIKALKD